MTQQTIQTSQALFDQAQKTIPGGVNSPVRAFGSVGGTPRFFTKANGPYLWDADGNRYVDTICSWGPVIVGHAHPKVIEAVKHAAEGGLSFGAPTRPAPPRRGLGRRMTNHPRRLVERPR